MTPEQKDRIVEAAQRYVAAHWPDKNHPAADVFHREIIAAVRAAEPKRYLVRLAPGPAQWFTLKGPGEFVIEGVLSLEEVRP